MYISFPQMRSVDIEPGETDLVNMAILSATEGRKQSLFETLLSLQNTVQRLQPSSLHKLQAPLRLQ